MNAIHQSEGRVLGALGDLVSRVAELEAWRRDVERNGEVSRAARDGRWWFPRMVANSIEEHWRVLTFIAALAFLAVAIFLDVRLDLSK